MKIGKYEFKCTCEGCPDQYDVFDEDANTIAYVRLCWGKLYAKCPDIYGDTVYCHDFSNDRGSFESDEERMKHLNRIANAIHDYYHRIRTVGDLIEVLQQLDKDAKISYDYGLPVRIDEFEDGYTIC